MDWPVTKRLFGVAEGEGVLDQAIPQLKMPVLAILGEHDYGAPPPQNRSIVKGFPNVTVLVFAKSGHNPMVEQPTEFDRALLHWLAAH
jgi:proline iminopeptidase